MSDRSNHRRPTKAKRTAQSSKTARATKAAHPFGMSAVRLVLNTFPRFISILLITTIGVAFFAGLRVTGNYMRENADAHLNSTNSMDIHVLSTFGFNDDDIADIRATPGVRDVYPAYNANVMAHRGSNVINVQVLSIDPRGSLAQNQPYFYSGRMPTLPNECLVEPNYMSYTGKSLGDTVIFVSDSNDDSTNIFDTLNYNTFTIVGVVDSPLFLARDRGSTAVGDGSNDFFFFLPESAFNLSVYTEVYVRMDGTDSDTSRFTSQYHQSVNSTVHSLEATAETATVRRYNQIIDDAIAELDDAQAELDEGKAELADALQELEDGRAELDDGWVELADARIRLNNSWAELRSARRELDEGWALLPAGRNRIDNGWVELSYARTELDIGWNELLAGRPELDEGWAQLADAWNQIEAGRAQIETLKYLIDDGWASLENALELGMPLWLYDDTVNRLRLLEQQYDDAVAEWQIGLDQYNESLAELSEAEAIYQYGKSKLEAGEAIYTDGYNELAQAEIDYADSVSRLERGERDYWTGLRKLEQAEIDYEDGIAKLVEAEADYTKGMAEYFDGVAKIEDGQAEIDEARVELSKLKMPQWYVLGIRDNAGFRTFESEASQLDALALILPAFFFLIAALVSMTAMTRLVDAERTVIATFKALGYQNAAISMRYLLYALTATIIGSIAGVALGFNVLPTMIFDAFRTLFNIPHTQNPFFFDYSLISAAVAIFSSVLPALLVVRKSVKENPAQAMRPLAPKAGQRIFMERIKPLWKRLSFLQKITARNLFRYKKRLLMTIFGVAGCTGLIFTALGLHDALSTVTTKQFGVVYKSDASLDFVIDDNDSLESLVARVNSYDEIIGQTLIYQRSMRISNSELTKDVSLVICYNPADFSDFINLSSRESLFNPSVSYQLDDSGVLLTEQIARQFGVGIGDTITLRTLEGESATFVVAGIIENYTMHYCYVSPAVYERSFGEVPEPNRMMIRTRDSVDLPSALVSDPAVRSVAYTRAVASNVAEQLDVLTFVVVILIVSAGVLIFVVLFSLNTINIEERRRELASIKVLGFYDGELATYIYRENVILTTVGAAFGLVLGFLLQRYIITTLEIDMFIFSRDILWTSYVISIVLTFVFAFFVNMIMYRPLTRINMVEALKAVE